MQLGMTQQRRRVSAEIVAIVEQELRLVLRRDIRLAWRSPVASRKMVLLRRRLLMTASRRIVIASQEVVNDRFAEDCQSQ